MRNSEATAWEPAELAMWLPSEESSSNEHYLGQVAESLGAARRWLSKTSCADDVVEVVWQAAFDGHVRSMFVAHAQIRPNLWEYAKENSDFGRALGRCRASLTRYVEGRPRPSRRHEAPHEAEARTRGAFRVMEQNALRPFTPEGTRRLFTSLLRLPAIAAMMLEARTAQAPQWQFDGLLDATQGVANDLESGYGLYASGEDVRIARALERRVMEAGAESARTGKEVPIFEGGEG